jgi:hypothetical protein
MSAPAQTHMYTHTHTHTHTHPHLETHTETCNRHLDEIGGDVRSGLTVQEN